MDNFLFSLGVVMPTFLTALLGYYLKQKGMFTMAFLQQLDKYIFSVALPCLMVKDIASSNIMEMFSPRFAFICFVGTTFMFLGFWGICYPLIKDKNFIGTFVQCSARGSVAVFGTSIAINIYGTSGVTPLLIAITVPLYNIYTVILLSLKSENGEKILSAKNMKKIGKEVVTNPLIIGIVIGAFFSVTPASIPEVLFKPLSSIAATGTPLALLSLGASMHIKELRTNVKPALIATFFRLIGFGALIIPISALLGMRDSSMVAILIMATSPCTVTAYIMTKNMGGDFKFASKVVILSTILSAFTMTLWLTVLKTFMLI